MKKLLFKLFEFSGPIWGGILNHIVFPIIQKIQQNRKMKVIEELKKKDDQSVQAIETILASKPKSKVDKIRKDKELKKHFKDII